MAVDLGGDQHRDGVGVLMVDAGSVVCGGVDHDIQAVCQTADSVCVAVGDVFGRARQNCLEI